MRGTFLFPPLSEDCTSGSRPDTGCGIKRDDGDDDEVTLMANDDGVSN